jgi:type IV pilus assembly protein PilO
MTNLQNFTTPDIALEERRTDRRLLQGVPLAVGGVLAALLLGAWVVPASLRLNSDWQRIGTLKDKKNQLGLLRDQLDQTLAQKEQAADSERRLLGLIAGSGDISTFMAKVNLEALRHGVQLDQLQPVAAPAPPPDASQAKTEAEKQAAEAAAAAQGCGALAQSGFSAQRRSLVATGRYPNLLAFMRALENLSLLVVQCDLALQQPPPQGAANPNQPAAAPDMQVRFELSLFEKGEPAPATAAGQAPAAAQP